MRKKRQSSWQCRLALLGHTSVKAAHKTLVKLTPGVNFTNILPTQIPNEQKKRVTTLLSF